MKLFSEYKICFIKIERGHKKLLYRIKGIVIPGLFNLFRWKPERVYIRESWDGSLDRFRVYNYPSTSPWNEFDCPRFILKKVRYTVIECLKKIIEEAQSDSVFQASINPLSASYTCQTEYPVS